jgi:hypothetical protein
MANTPESPFDRINRLLQQQNLLTAQQSQEMQTAITSAVEDFPNRLADAQSLLNQNVSSIMTDFGPKSQEITSQLGQLKLDPSQQLQFEQQLNAGLTQLKSQSGQLGNFKIPNISGVAGSGIDLFAGGTGDLQNAISSANFGEFDQAISQGTAALGQSIESGQVQNAINSAAGQLSDQLGNLPDQFSQFSQSLQIPGEGNPALSFSGLNADELQRLSADAVTNLEDIVSGDDLGVLLGQVQQGAPEFQAFFDQLSLGSGEGAAAGKEQKSMSEQKVDNSKKVGGGENKLHDFESYTYRLTMYLLTKEELKTAFEEPSEFVPKHVILSSGGGYTDRRLPDFQEDFMIDDLDFTTVVGLNSRSKASNAIDVTFTITEPYGITFLDRLLSACETVGGCPNYVEQPYLLEITFLGNPSGSNPNTFIDQKRIPIKFMEMQIKPSASGTQYKCRAIPFNHLAFLNTVAAVPRDLAVLAGTVGEFLATEQDLDGVLKKNKERAAKDLEAFLSNQSFGGAGFSAEAREQKRREFQNQYLVKANSFPGAYNAYFADVSGDEKNKTFKYPPAVIKFVLDPEFETSKIVHPEDTDARTVEMNNPNARLKGTFTDGLLTNGRTKQEFPIRAGTNVIQVLDRLMQRSDYIVNQVKSSAEIIERLEEAKKKKSANQAQQDQNVRDVRALEEKAKQFKYLDWYKIIPHVELAEFDSKRNAYAKKVTYHIKKYRAANAYHPDFKLTRITKDKIVRSYEYFYTGNNKDIINLSIDFDSTFYTQITAYQGKKSRVNAKTISHENSTANPDKVDNKSVESNGPADQPITNQSLSANSDNAGQLNRQDNASSQAVSDIAKSIYTTQRGDMLNLQVGIIGDPDFVKQDDCYINPQSKEYNDFVFNPDDSPINPKLGTVVFDSQQVYVQLLFKNAVDIDDSVGLTNKGLAGGGGKPVVLSNGRKLNASFSGVYKVVTVSNQFKKGEFTQMIDIIKMPNDLLESEGEDTVEGNAQNGSVTLDPVDNGGTPRSTAQATESSQPQASSLDRSDSGAQGLAGDAEESAGAFQADIDRVAPAFAESPTAPIEPIDGQGTAEGQSVGQIPGLTSIIDLNKQQITATVNNIANTDFQTEIGTINELFSGQIIDEEGNPVEE